MQYRYAHLLSFIKRRTFSQNFGEYFYGIIKGVYCYKHSTQSQHTGAYKGHIAQQQEIREEHKWNELELL